ncbi:CoA transferase [Rhodopseudomonas palustris]|uniref:CoA transferase n=1 Tax=Rhodopseudomonas palustris TaxID=1076 RepID=UPI0021F2A2DC|nr:CoA transferase [Rhodopseudomonas palustris]
MSQVIDRPDLSAAAVYASVPDRVRRRDELFALLADAVAHYPWAHWQARMRSGGVPRGQLRSVGEAIRSPEARA